MMMGREILVQKARAEKISRFKTGKLANSTRHRSFPYFVIICSKASKPWLIFVVSQLRSLNSYKGYLIKISFLLFLFSGIEAEAKAPDPNDFFTEFEFELPASVGRVTQIIYGSNYYGYYKTNEVRRLNAKKIATKILPPGYVKPIGFWAQISGQDESGKDRVILLAKKKLPSPLPLAFKGIDISVKGVFSSPFFAVSLSLPLSRLDLWNLSPIGPDLPLKNENRFCFPAIINRFGEIVWLFIPQRNGQAIHDYVYLKPVGRNLFGMITGKREGYFGLVDIAGKDPRSLDSKKAVESFPMHHDFVMLTERTMLTISNRLEIAPKGSNLFEGESFLTNTIIQVDLAKNESRVVLDLSRYYNPSNVSYFKEQSVKKRFVAWGESAADHDFLHTNAIERVPGVGYMIGMKHLDRVVLFDEILASELWSVGPSPEDSFQATGKARFSHQHTPRFIKPNRLLLFDNGFLTQESRVLMLELNKKTKKAEFVWDYSPTPKFFSDNRSSVEQLSGGNVLVYFVEPDIDGKRQSENQRVDFMIEFDPRKKSEKARMRLGFFSTSPGYRATSLETLGSELVLTREAVNLLPGR